MYNTYMKRKIILLIAFSLCFSVSAFAFFGKKKVDPIPMTLEELAQYDGKNGNPMYVAVDGLIYDLTKCRYWKEGVHTESMEEGIAGRDLTELLKKSTHGIKRVKRYPHVGYLVDKKEPSTK